MQDVAVILQSAVVASAAEVECAQPMQRHHTQDRWLVTARSKNMHVARIPIQEQRDTYMLSAFTKSSGMASIGMATFKREVIHD